MTNSVDICGDGSSRHSVGTHGMMPPVCYGRIKGGVYNEEVRSGYIFCVGAVFGDAAHFCFCGGKDSPLQMLMSFYNLQKRWTMANMMTKQMRLYLLKRIWI